MMTMILTCRLHDRECTAYEGWIRHSSAPGFYGAPCDSELFGVSYNVTRGEVLAPPVSVTLLHRDGCGCGACP